MTKIKTFLKVYITENITCRRRAAISFSLTGIDIYHAVRYIAVVTYEAWGLKKHNSYTLLLSYNFIKVSMVVDDKPGQLLWHYSSKL